MALRLTQLTEANRPAFETLLADAWEQNWGPELTRELVRWRYYERPSGGGTWLAVNDGQAVAMLDSFVRPYLLDGRRVQVRAGCDWYCLPKYRPLGLGVRLMRELMACAEPMISVGGKDATLEILPRLGWTRMPDVQNFVLPVTVRALASALLRKRWPHREAYAGAIPGFLPLRRPRRPAPPPGGRVAKWRPGTPTGLADAPDPGLVQLLDPADRDWLVRMPPSVAQPLGFVFFLDDRPVGFSLAQVEPARTGLDGRIVHLQVDDPAAATLEWIVAETASRLVAHGVGMIRCWASSPEKIAALGKVGFTAAKPLPSYWWSKSGLACPTRTDLGYLHADDAIPFSALRGRHVSAPAREKVLAQPAPA
jgi:hypothetical protein